MKTHLFISPTAFEELSGEWDVLIDPRRSDNLFLNNRWQRVWWKHLSPGELSIVTVRDDEGVLRGIGPWFIESGSGQRTVRLIGCTEIVDYLDILCMPGYEESVYGALLDFMLSAEAPIWDRFELCNIPQSSPTLAVMPQMAEKRGLHSVIDEIETCPVIDLPGSYEEYLETLDKKQRHELRRKRRRAEAAGVGWYIVGPEHNLEEEIQAFLRLMAMSTPEKAAFLEIPGHRLFFEEMGPMMFEMGYLDLVFLTVQGERAAAMWQFHHRDRVMLYNSGLNPVDFSHLSAGIVLLTYSIENAIERGFHKYDFLRGGEEYKFRMGARPTTIQRLTIAREA